MEADMTRRTRSVVTPAEELLDEKVALVIQAGYTDMPTGSGASTRRRTDIEIHLLDLAGKVLTARTQLAQAVAREHDAENGQGDPHSTDCDRWMSDVDVAHENLTEAVAYAIEAARDSDGGQLA